MMIAGFGMVGFGLRSRRKQSVRVTYALTVSQRYTWAVDLSGLTAFV